MRMTHRLVLLTFLESCATIFVERGVYFYAHEQLAFSRWLNLWLALAFGAAYVVGASASHAISRRVGEKRLLLAAIAAQMLVHSALAVWMGPVLLFFGHALLGLLHGTKWPLIESYVSAGYDPRDTARAVGRFNVSWASAVPVTLIATGPILVHVPGSVFATAALMNAAGLLLGLGLGTSPAYLPHDHPTRPAEHELALLRPLLVSSRWLLLAGYSLMWILAAVVPQVLESLACPDLYAPGLSSVMDMLRFTAFAVLGTWAGWHGKRWTVFLGVVGLPAGFFLAVFADQIAAAAGVPAGYVAVLGGQVLFGAAVGTVYNAALYYGMVVKNAGVDAGGAHEGLIGLGFTVGPAAGLAGLALAPMLGGVVFGTIVGVAPVLALCGLAALRCSTAPRPE